MDKMDKICFCLCCALQPVSKSAGVSRGLVGWVSRGWYWLVLDGAGSVKGGTGWYLMVLGQKRAVLVGT